MAVTRKPAGSHWMVDARDPRFRYAIACRVPGGSAGSKCRESEVFPGGIGSSSRASAAASRHTFRLEPLELARSHGFSARELNLIRRLVGTHLAGILETPYEHCG
jgi:hypothetical protein